MQKLIITAIALCLVAACHADGQTQIQTQQVDAKRKISPKKA